MKLFWATVKATHTHPVRHITSIALRRYTISEDKPNRFSLTVTHAEDGKQIFRQGAFFTLEAAKIWARQDIALLRSHNPHRHNAAPRTIARAQG